MKETKKFVWETGLRLLLVLPPPGGSWGSATGIPGTVGRARRNSAAAAVSFNFLHRARYALRYRLLWRGIDGGEGWRT